MNEDTRLIFCCDTCNKGFFMSARRLSIVVEKHLGHKIEIVKEEVSA